MRIEILWSMPPANSAILTPRSTLAQALLYADSVMLMAPESDDLLESEDWLTLMEIFGSSVDHVSLDNYDNYYQRNPAKSLQFLQILVLEAASLLAINEDRSAFKRLRQAQGGVDYFRPHMKKRNTASYPDDLTELVERTLTESSELARMTSFIRRQGLNSSGRFSQSRRRFTESEIKKLVRLVGVFEFTQRSLEPEAYPLVDDARGVWRGAQTQAGMLSGGGRKRAANASLALGQIQRLPSIRALDWYTVKDVRDGLTGPLARFRGAMAKISEEANQHPLDSSFNDFIEQVWITSVAPAIEEVEELSRQARFRSVFFDDVLGKLTTYSTPAIALAAGNIANLPLGVQAAVGLAAPAANAIAAIRAKRRVLASKDFLFLRLVEKRMSKLV